MDGCATGSSGVSGAWNSMVLDITEDFKITCDEA